MVRQSRYLAQEQSAVKTRRREKRLVRACGNSWVSNLVVIDKAMNRTVISLSTVTTYV